MASFNSSVSPRQLRKSYDGTKTRGTWGTGRCSRSADGGRKKLRTSPSEGLHPMDVAVRSLCRPTFAAQACAKRRMGNGRYERVRPFAPYGCSDTIYVGTDDARMLRLSDAGSMLDPIDGFDSVAGRMPGSRFGNCKWAASWATAWSRPTRTGADPFANVHVGGIPRSMNGGKNLAAHHSYQQRCSWRCARTRQIWGHCHRCVRYSAFALAATRGDVDHRTGAPPLSYCSAVAFSGDDILVSASTDHFAAQGLAWMDPWQPSKVVGCGSGPDLVEHRLHRGANGSLIAVADTAGSLYVSDDFGLAWSRGTTRLSTPSGVLIR